MPVETSIDTQKNLITFEVTGALVLDEIQEALERSYSDPTFKAGMNSLWQIKEGRIGVTASQLPDLLDILSQMVEKRGTGYKVAIVVRKNIDFGLSTIFEMHSYSMPFDVKVFQSLTQAKKWLSEDPGQ